MNSNLFHNIANLLIALLAAITAFALATGCTTLPTGVLECSMSWIDPKMTVLLTGGLGVLKVLVNIARDGFFGLWKQQPPVQ